MQTSNNTKLLLAKRAILVDRLFACHTQTVPCFSTTKTPELSKIIDDQMNVFICILACSHYWHLSCLQASPHHLCTQLLQSQPAADLCLPVVGPYHSHPSDLKHRFHRHQSSASLHGSFNHNHVQDTNLPLVTEEHDENSDGKGPVYDPKQDVFVSLFVSLHGNEALTCEVGLRRFPICFPTSVRIC